MSAIVVNLYGGPGCGKSTTAALVFGELKKKGINCEMALEYAKDKVWEESLKTLDDQIYIFGKQLHKLWRLKDKVDVIITDSPLLMSMLYDKEKSELFKALIFEQYKNFDNLDFFITRSTIYERVGRIQSEEEAEVLDGKLLDIIRKYSAFDVVDKDNAVKIICDNVLKKIKA